MTERQQEPASVFVRDGERLVPTAWAQSAWREGTQHGAPATGLLARAFERHAAEEGLQLTRLTVELVRAAPMAPLTTRVRVRHAGKRVHHLEASVEAEGQTMLTAIAMGFRADPLPMSETADGGNAQPPAPLAQAGPAYEWASRRSPDGPSDFVAAMEMRPVEGCELPTAWLRLTVPLVEGEKTSALERVAICADMTYGLPLMVQMTRSRSAAVDRPFVIINPDTTVNLHRPARGEWICVESSVVYGSDGAGTALARLFDEHGAIGGSSQSVLVRGVAARPDRWEGFANR